MPAPTSAVDICNLAATLLTTSNISSIEPPDEGSKFAQECAKWYDIARREALRAATWNFAKTSAVIPADTTDPLFDWSKRYRKPADFIRVASIRFNGETPLTDKEYDFEGDYILCNETGMMQLSYIYDHNNPAKWTPDFITMFANILAKYVGVGISGLEGGSSKAEERSKELKRDAKIVNGQEQRPRRTESSRLLARRRRISGSVKVR